MQQRHVARDVPLALLRVVPPRLFDTGALQGNCVMHRDRGHIEVACRAQQQVLLQRGTPASRGDSAPSSRTGGRVSRFTFQDE